jgi:flavin-dependent dehydrogenase
VLDKSSYPRVKICGSGLSPHALGVIDRLGLRAAIEPHHVPMRGLTAIGPGGTKVHLRGAKGAWVVPRRELDHAIVSAAQAAGATFHEDTKATELVRDGHGQVRGVETSAGTFEADVVVCANGSPSRFEIDTAPREGIRTIMGWWQGARPSAPDEGVMIWDERLAGYYAWLFPEPGGVVNIGLTIPEHASDAARLKPLFHELLDQYFGEVLHVAEPVGKWMGHPATVTRRVGPVVEARALWCGEAARLVCPGTVEGIGFALESGMIAGEELAHVRPGTGLTALQRARYRGRTAMRMLPTFWAGAAFVRLMRSPTARRLATRIASPRWLSERAAALVGESQR